MGNHDALTISTAPISEAVEIFLGAKKIIIS